MGLVQSLFFSVRTKEGSGVEYRTDVKCFYRRQCWGKQKYSVIFIKFYGNLLNLFVHSKHILHLALTFYLGLCNASGHVYGSHEYHGFPVQS